jgi:hypothetical protein
MAFQSNFKLSASRLITKDANEKNEGGEGTKQKRKEDEIFISGQITISKRPALWWHCSYSSMTQISAGKQPSAAVSRTTTSIGRPCYPTYG